MKWIVVGALFRLPPPPGERRARRHLRRSLHRAHEGEHGEHYTEATFGAHVEEVVAHRQVAPDQKAARPQQPQRGEAIHPFVPMDLRHGADKEARDEHCARDEPREECGAPNAVGAERRHVASDQHQLARDARADEPWPPLDERAGEHEELDEHERRGDVPIGVARRHVESVALLAHPLIVQTGHRAHRTPHAVAQCRFELGRRHEYYRQRLQQRHAKKPAAPRLYVTASKTAARPLAAWAEGLLQPQRWRSHDDGPAASSSHHRCLLFANSKIFVAPVSFFCGMTTTTSVTLKPFNNGKPIGAFDGIVDPPMLVREYVKIMGGVGKALRWTFRGVGHEDTAPLVVAIVDLRAEQEVFDSTLARCFPPSCVTRDGP